MNFIHLFTLAAHVLLALGKTFKHYDSLSPLTEHSFLNDSKIKTQHFTQAVKTLTILVVG